MIKERVTVSTVVASWSQILTAMLANTGDFIHLDGRRARLQELLEQVRELVAQQDFHASARQDATRQLAVLLKEGRKLATFLRVGAKDRYGNRSEKLLEFGVQPFHRRLPDEDEPAAPFDPSGD